MEVVHLGLNSKTDFILYEETPIYVSKSNLFKIQGALDVRAVISTEKDGGIFIKAKVFRGIPNLIFFMDDKEQKAVKSSL